MNTAAVSAPPVNGSHASHRSLRSQACSESVLAQRSFLLVKRKAVSAPPVNGSHASHRSLHS